MTQRSSDVEEPIQDGGADGDCPSFFPEEKTDPEGPIVRKVGGMHRLGHIKNQAISRPLVVLANYQ